MEYHASLLENNYVMNMEDDDLFYSAGERDALDEIEHTLVSDDEFTIDEDVPNETEFVREVSDDEFTIDEDVPNEIEFVREVTDNESEDEFFIPQPLRLRRLALQTPANDDNDDGEHRRGIKKITSLDKALDYNNYGPTHAHPTAANIESGSKEDTIKKIY